MYIRKEGEVYMLDRDNAVFSIPSLKFPSRKHVDQHLNQTLVDGVRKFTSLFKLNHAALLFICCV